MRARALSDEQTLRHERCENQITAFLLIAFGNNLSKRASELVSTFSTNHRDAGGVGRPYRMHASA